METFRSIIILVLVVFLLPATVPAAGAAQKASGGNSAAAETAQVFQSQETSPRAILKDGLYVGIDKGKVSILEGRKSKKKSYRLAEDYRVVYNGQEIDWKEVGFIRIPPHSIVKLVMIEAQIVEIVLVEVSS